MVMKKPENFELGLVFLFMLLNIILKADKNENKSRG